MNCKAWEERLALYAGGDLTPAGAAEVERHLAECAGCQVFASGMKENLALMREVHDEAIAPAHFAAVRARVLAQLERQRNPWRRWAWASGVAAVVVAVLSWPRTIPEPPQVALYRPPAASSTLLNSRGSVPRKVRVSGVVAHKLPHRAATIKERTEGLMVKLLTDDPNVVIYWIADADKGGEPK